MKCLKSAATLFFLAKSSLSLMGLSNEVLCIFVAQGAAKLPEVKGGDTEKNLGLEPRPRSNNADQAEQQNIFSDLQLWRLAVLQSLKLQGCIVSHLKALILEQMNYPRKTFKLFNNMRPQPRNLRVSMLPSKNPQMSKEDFQGSLKILKNRSSTSPQTFWLPSASNGPQKI